MAKGLALKSKIYIIDTSYLLELFKVPGCYNPDSSKEIRKRHKDAIISESRLYVPLPCIIELGDHIADVSNGASRAAHAKILRETVVSSINNLNPWTITPVEAIENLPFFLDDYEKSYVIQQIGLTDTFIISEALRIKKKYSGLGYDVHIWTQDSTMKSYEPDKEENPFVG